MSQSDAQHHILIHLPNTFSNEIKLNRLWRYIRQCEVKDTENNDIPTSFCGSSIQEYFLNPGSIERDHLPEMGCVALSY